MLMLFQATGLDKVTYKVNADRENANIYMLRRKGRYRKKEWSRGKKEIGRVQSFKSSKELKKEQEYKDSNFFMFLTRLIMLFLS